MHQTQPIKDRNREQDTPYYPSRLMQSFPGIGEYPRNIQMLLGNEVYKTYQPAVLTIDFVYYIDEQEGDDNAAVLMFNRELRLISDNYFAYADLFEIVHENAPIVWASEIVKYWQQQITQEPPIFLP